MPVTSIQYGTLTNFTITLASLANNAARSSLAISNSGNFLDAQLFINITLLTGTPANDLGVNLWFYGSHDGTNYGDPAVGTDATITLRNPTNLFGRHFLSTPDAGALTYRCFVPSVAQFFGDVLPVSWGVVVENRTNLAFSATEPTIKQWRGIKLEVV